MVCLPDCITISYFNYQSYFPIADKKPTGIFFESVLRTGLRPYYRLMLIIFTKQLKNRNFVSLAAPLSAHSTHSLKQKGFFRRVPA